MKFAFRKTYYLLIAMIIFFGIFLFTKKILFAILAAVFTGSFVTLFIVVFFGIKAAAKAAAIIDNKISNLKGFTE